MWRPICVRCFEEHNDGADGIEWDGEVYWTYCRKCDFWTEHPAEEVEHQEDPVQPDAKSRATPDGL